MNTELTENFSHGNTSTPASPTRSSRVVRTTLIAIALVVAGLFTSISSAFAETDPLANQCIVVGGYTRACTDWTNVIWGSGTSWSAGASVMDKRRGDGWTATVEVSLNRKWMSNTSWIQVVRGFDYSYYSESDRVSGHDPTYGAWVRLCVVNGAGTKYCNDSRYVTDNS